MFVECEYVSLFSSSLKQRIIAPSSGEIEFHSLASGISQGCVCEIVLAQHEEFQDEMEWRKLDHLDMQVLWCKRQSPHESSDSTLSTRTRTRQILA